MTASRKPKPEPTPSLSERARKVEVRNILKKLNDGKSITRRESDLLAEHDAQNEQALTVTCQQVAIIVAAPKQTITKLTKAGILPRTSKGTYYLPDTIPAYLRHCGINERPDEAKRRASVVVQTAEEKLRVVKSQADLNEKKLEILSGNFVHRADIETALAPVIADLINAMRTSLESEFANWCIGKGAAQIKRELQSRIDAIIAKVRCETGDALDTAQKKVQGDASMDEGASADPAQKVEALRVGRPRDPNSVRSRRAREKAKGGKK